MIKFCLTRALPLLWLSFSAYATNSLESDIAKGKQKAAICAGCHGERGISPIAQYPNLAGQSSRYLSKQLQDFQQGAAGRSDPMMDAFAAQLSADDIQHLALYYASLPNKAAATDSSDSAGRALYIGGDMSRDIAACSACHGVNAQGLAAAGFPALAGQNEAYIKAQLEKFKTAERHNDLNGMMVDISRKLNDKEITALAAFLAGL
ncbi:cytochrome c4 [Shewanella avicenniae]|uniref:Cytochrome c4 n=1 Tax=Shewanella avicenniae TaxID=2814294 RepID=A0ABX7QQF5_9GAMM|nr:c-type cytochrome [Shewanella avicenniae]QSX33639.1 cytochrome c4 [Shewanella avicenniae]